MLLLPLLLLLLLLLLPCLQFCGTWRASVISERPSCHPT
jgi:hypothetical protein